MSFKRQMCALFCLSLAALPLAAGEDQWERAMTEARAAGHEGRTKEALRAYEKAIDIAEAEPTRAVQQAIAMVGRAYVLQDVQRTREAEKEYVEALSILRAQPRGEAQRHIPAVVISLAALYLESHQPSKAVSLQLEKMVPTIEGAAVLANAYGVLGSMALVQRRLDDAEAWWLKALSLYDAQRPTEDVAVLLSNLGVSQSERLKFEGAAVYFRRSVDIFAATIGLEHPRAVKVQGNYGHALYRLRKYSDAAEWLGRSHRLAQQWYGTDNPVTIQLCLDHAQALRKLGRKDEAEVLFESVRRLPAGVTAALRGHGTIDVMNLQSKSSRR